MDVSHIHRLTAVQRSSHDSSIVDRRAHNVAPGKPRGGERLRCGIEPQQRCVGCVEELRERSPHRAANSCEGARRHDLPEHPRQSQGPFIVEPRGLQRTLRGGAQMFGPARCGSLGTSLDFSRRIIFPLTVRSLEADALSSKAATMGAIAEREARSAGLNEPSFSAAGPTVVVSCRTPTAGASTSSRPVRQHGGGRCCQRALQK